MNFRNSIYAVGAVLALSTSANAQFNHRYYVDADALLSNGDGQSWGQAFRFLSDALEESETYLLSNNGPIEVWVAKGTYRPDQSRFVPQGTNSRSASFNLVPETSLFGGFAGDETERSQRNWNDPANRTVLTGEIGAPQSLDNSYHVINASFSSDIQHRALVDGFVVTRGAATGTFDQGEGGGVYSSFGSADLFNCTFLDNIASGRGGAVFLDPAFFSTPRIVNCQFSGNAAFGRGAAIALVDNTAILNQCLLSRNGGASDVSPQQRGGALLTTGNAELLVYSSTIVNNLSDVGGHLRAEDSSQISIANSILWGGSATTGNGDQAYVEGHLSLSHVAIEGGLSGILVAGGAVATTPPGTVYGADPLFADEGFDDYRLRPGSPYHELANGSLHQADLADLDQDGVTAEPTPRDLAGSVRIRGMALGLGAFEGGSLGQSYCTTIPNTTGSVSTLYIDGSGLAGEPITLRGIQGPPQQFGFFLVAKNEGMIPNPSGSMGVLCLGGSLGRIIGPEGVFQFDAGGVSQTGTPSGAVPVNTSMLPSGLGAIQPGETWRFQAWHRDGASSNFGEPLAVMFE